MNALLSQVLVLLGVVLGATLQHFFSRSADRARHERDLRVGAYVDYLKAVGESETTVANPHSQRSADIRGRAIFAKARVCALGASPVVVAIATFEMNPALGLTEERRARLVALVKAIRTDVGAKGSDALDAHIAGILFGQ